MNRINFKRSSKNGCRTAGSSNETVKSWRLSGRNGKWNSNKISWIVKAKRTKTHNTRDIRSINWGIEITVRVIIIINVKRIKENCSLFVKMKSRREG